MQGPSMYVGRHGQPAPVTCGWLPYVQSGLHELAKLRSYCWGRDMRGCWPVEVELYMLGFEQLLMCVVPDPPARRIRPKQAAGRNLQRGGGGHALGRREVPGGLCEGAALLAHEVVKTHRPGSRGAGLRTRTSAIGVLRECIYMY